MSFECYIKVFLFIYILNIYPKDEGKKSNFVLPKDTNSRVRWNYILICVSNIFLF